jgi:hypothetical protein
MVVAGWAMGRECGPYRLQSVMNTQVRHLADLVSSAEDLA